MLRYRGGTIKHTTISGITQNLYDTKQKEYKEYQADILEQMKEHSQADADFHITANTVLSLTQRACEIFDRSEVHEKRALLNFLLQNCTLEGKNLLFKLKTPFDRVLLANKFKLAPCSY